jgi:hypothetical protein
MKYLVFIDEGNGWEPQGDGPLGLKTAERIAREIREECHVKTKIEPVRYDVSGRLRDAK